MEATIVRGVAGSTPASPRLKARLVRDPPFVRDLPFDDIDDGQLGGAARVAPRVRRAGHAGFAAVTPHKPSAQGRNRTADTGIFSPGAKRCKSGERCRFSAEGRAGVTPVSQVRALGGNDRQGRGWGNSGLFVLHAW